MAVPTIADVDGDGTLEIVVSLKDGGAAGGSVLVFDRPRLGPQLPAVAHRPRQPAAQRLRAASCS